MNDQSVPTEVAAEDALLAAMGGEEPQEEQEEDLEDVPPEEGDAPESDSEPEGEEETKSEEYFDLTVNGEQIKKSKAEVLELAQKGEDYTRKTQQLAEERRVLQAQAQMAQQQAKLQEAIVDKLAVVKSIESQLQQFQSVDWNALVDSDPVQAMKLDRQYRDLQNFYQSKVNEVHQAANEVQARQGQFMQEMLKREHQSMLEAIPDWKDSAKFAAEKGDLKSYLAKSGFNEQEISNATDHRHIVIARKAMLYDKLISEKPSVTKKVSEAPKPVKSSAPQVNKNREAYKQTRETLKRTGRTDAAERAILALL